MPQMALAISFAVEHQGWKAHTEGKTTPQNYNSSNQYVSPPAKKVLKTCHATGESSADGADFAGGACTAAEVLVFGVT